MGFLKGSQEAKDHMAKIRAMKGNRANTTEKQAKMMSVKCVGKTELN